VGAGVNYKEKVMIRFRNLDDSLQQRIGNGQYNVGWHGGTRDRAQGGFWYVDPGAGSAGQGKSWDDPVQTITQAMALADFNEWDTIFCAPGNHTGNHITPLNTSTPFCSVVGMRNTSLGLAAWMGATDQALPIFQVRARGWRITGFEFDNPTTSNTVSAGIQIYNPSGNATRGDYLEVDHCLFTGGKAGIRYRDAATYIHIHDNQFDYMSGTNNDGRDGAICSASSAQALGGRWLVERNIFAEVAYQMDIAGGARGLNSSVIRDNIFQVDAQATTGVVLIDIRGGGAGNLICNNFFGCTIAQYKSGAFVRTNASDEGIGNWCADGIPDGVIEH
jgi:hypothetical protein